ncbi:MAG TPA: hypothetical protein VFB06_07160 [Streptosporangiaceae bacterium]|nr:hypothetical protein [Streptosporangiaceae bacterium]
MSFRPFRALAAATASMAIFALAPAALAGTPGVHQITGAKLAKALLPASSFGRGYKAMRPIDTGNSLQPGTDAFHIATMSCSSFWNIYGEPALGETALASDDVSNRAALIDDQEIVYQLPSARAAKSFYSTGFAKYGKCRHITLSGGGSPTMYVKTQSIAKTHVGRYTAFAVTQQDTFAHLPGSLYTFTLFAMAGDDAFILEANTPTAAKPNLTALAARLISRVSALH